jgi:ribosomal protein S18 acetylase RimI-like enzyme
MSLGEVEGVPKSSRIPWQITPADWRDYSQLNHLEKACFKPNDAWPFWDLLGVLTLPGIIRLKAIIDDRMIGFISGEREQARRLGWVTSLAVLPEYRRQGVASELLKDGEEALAMPNIRLSVRKSNFAAIHLYETHGYIQIDCWRKYYAGGEDALVFEKRR